MSAADTIARLYHARTCTTCIQGRTCGGLHEGDEAFAAEVLAALGAKTREEWGVVGGPGRQDSAVHTRCTDPGGFHRAYDERLARTDTANRPEDLRVRHVTTIRHATEWSEA